MLNRLQANTIRSWLLPLFLSLALSSAHADSGKAADVVAVGLPLVAAGISMYHGDTDGLWQLAKSEATTLAVTEILKATVHETRPDGSDDHSFPSRHASVAFAAAQFMQIRGGWAYGIPAYIAATAVAYQRVDQKEHYTKDVIVGALIGIASSTFFTDKPYKAALSYSPSDRAVLANVSMRW